MCLKTDNPIIKTADRDILVYKKCVGVSNEECYPSFRYFKYEKNKLNEPVTLRPYGYGTVKSVDEGYHSFTYPQKETNTVFKIPKGSHYIDGWFNDDRRMLNRVSSNIIYIGPVKYNWIERIIARIFTNHFV